MIWRSKHFIRDAVTAVAGPNHGSWLNCPGKTKLFRTVTTLILIAMGLIFSAEVVFPVSSHRAVRFGQGVTTLQMVFRGPVKDRCRVDQVSGSFSSQALHPEVTLCRR